MTEYLDIDSELVFPGFGTCVPLPLKNRKKHSNKICHLSFYRLVLCIQKIKEGHASVLTSRHSCVVFYECDCAEDSQ